MKLKVQASQTLQFAVSLIFQNAPAFLKKTSMKIAHSQTICKVVATVLIFVLYVAAIGGIVRKPHSCFLLSASDLIPHLYALESY